MHQLSQNGNIGWSLRQLQVKAQCLSTVHIYLQFDSRSWRLVCSANQVQTWHDEERCTHITEQRIDLVCDNGAHGGRLQTHAHHLPQAELELEIATVLVSSSDGIVDGFTCGWHVDSELQVHLHTQALHMLSPVVRHQ